MTQEAPSCSPLPKAPVLGYLSNISTPTRVRVVAARVVLAFAILNLALAALALGFELWNIWQFAHNLAAGGWMGGRIVPPHSPALDDYLLALRIVLDVRTLLCLSLFPAPGIALLFLAGPIRRGRKAAGILALVYFLPLMLLLTLATALYGAAILVAALGFGSRPAPAMYVWLLLLPVGIVFVLLLSDLCGFLSWIARNPMVDKPPVAFLPMATAGKRDTTH
jgi:hypothetical protein